MLSTIFFILFLITCLVAFNTHPQTWREILGGGLSPQAPDERRLCSSPSTYRPNFIEIEETFCGRTDVRTNGRTDRPTLLGGLGGVDLKQYKNNNNPFNDHYPGGRGEQVPGKHSFT